MSWTSYDETIPANGVEPSRLLSELQDSFGLARVRGVNGPWAKRPAREQVEIFFTPVLSEAEQATASAIYAAHDASTGPTTDIPVMGVSADHDLGVDTHERMVDASAQMVTVTLPRMSNAPARPYVVKATGAHGMTVMPHPDDEGVTIDGAPSLVVTDGDAVRIGAASGGMWCNLNAG